jgi:signal transduction histidine kinase
MEALQAEHIPWLILLGTAGMLMLIGFIGVFILLYQKRMLNEKQKRITRELEYQNQMIQLQLDSQEQERKRIGADLHDSLGSLLWGAKVNAALLCRSGNLKDDNLEAYNDLIKILDESLATIRKIAWELTPEAFQHAGLSDSIRKLCTQLDGKPIHISFTENKPVQWNDERALHVFRIMQELISNTFKHSGASQLTIVFSWSEETLVIHFSDNGKGIAAQAERNGVGLWNVAQRVKQLMASFQIGNDTDYTGLKITISVPLKV